MGGSGNGNDFTEIGAIRVIPAHLWCEIHGAAGWQVVITGVRQAELTAVKSAAKNVTRCDGQCGVAFTATTGAIMFARGIIRQLASSILFMQEMLLTNLACRMKADSILGCVVRASCFLLIAWPWLGAGASLSEPNPEGHKFPPPNFLATLF